MGVGSKDSVPAGFPKKNSGLAPEGLSILAGTGAGHRPLWRPTMALKIKASGVPRGSPLARLCLLSSCEERRWPAGQTFVAVCPRIKNAVLLKRTSTARPLPFVRVSARSDKRGKNAAGVPSPQIAGRFSFYENRRKRPHLNLRHTERGCRPKGLGSYKIM